jgi:transcriptional regulator with PAS, ATPase and Fis domain
LTKKVILKIFSAKEEVSSIFTAVSQVRIQHPYIEIKQESSFSFDEDEILVVHVKKLNSNIITAVASSKNDIRNKIIFIIEKNSGIIASTIAKLGFNEIFIFPSETYKFISFLNDIVSLGSYKTGRSPKSLLPDFYNLDKIITHCHVFQKIIDIAKKLSERKEIDILILGETGTGKGVLARAIHEYPEDQSPFVDILCTAIPETLLEAELFGFEPGSFTSAKKKKIGLFEFADYGTIFLDEIGDLGYSLQAKLLRVLSNKTIRRIGGVVDIPVNARIISATNRNIQSMVEKRVFRKDLFYRINTVTLEIPPLRERKEDIFPLAYYFIEQFNSLFNKDIADMDREIKEFIFSYPWPGNVRELKNSFERAILLSETSVLTKYSFSQFFDDPYRMKPEQKNTDVIMPGYIRLDVSFKDLTLLEVNRIYAKMVLEHTNGNKSRAAKYLGISRPKLDSLLNKE